jgi:hypothetical protein
MKNALNEISPALLQGIGYKALLLQDHLPNLDLTTTVRHLSALNDDKATQLKAGNFGSLAFDVVFSPGILPKKRERDYRRAYTAFFREQYGLEVFDQDDFFVFQNEENFYPSPGSDSNDIRFLTDWVANLRAVALMLGHFRPNESVSSIVCNNLIESALCRMAENGEHWPEDLIYALPYAMQERLQTLRAEVEARLDEGYTLAPGQFFHLANDLEFREREFMRAATHQRVEMVVDQLDERRPLLPPEPAFSALSFAPPVDWRHPTGRQFRQVNLSAVMHNHEQAGKWTNYLLRGD